VVDKKEIDACVKHINNNNGWYEGVRNETLGAVNDYLHSKYGKIDDQLAADLMDELGWEVKGAL